MIACQDLAKLKRADRFGPWLAGICRNLARRLLRSQGRMTGVSMAFDVQATESHDSHQLDVLREALNALKPGERETPLRPGSGPLIKDNTDCSTNKARSQYGTTEIGDMSTKPNTTGSI